MDEFSLRSLVKAVVLPPTGPLLVALLGLVLIRARCVRLGMGLAAVGIVTLWLLCTPLIAGVLVRWYQYPQTLDLQHPTEAQAVVILAGGARQAIVEYHGPAPMPRTLQRLVYGARVAHATELPVLITGGKIETAAMKNMLVTDFSIRPRWVDSSATNTHDNARFSCALLQEAGVNRIILVTSALHMRRATAEFRSQGLAVVPAPVDVRGPGDYELGDLIPDLAALHDSEYVFYEVAGEASRRLLSLLNPAGSVRAGSCTAVSSLESRAEVPSITL